jgi:hypothetical protein
MVGRVSALRSLAVAMAVLFFAATLLQLADQLNLVYQPPNIPDSANLVDRITALIPYHRDEWPIYFGANFPLALGFAVLVGLGFVLAARITRADDRRPVLLWTLVSAGVLGAVGQLVLIGAFKASIDVPYCDCGFKDQEIVSQIWSEMVVQSAVQWLIYGASLLAAGGLVVAGQVFGGRQMPTTWAWLSYLNAALLAVAVLFGYANVRGDLATWVTALVVGILIPGWALWLGLGYGREEHAEADLSSSPAPD